MAARRSLWSYTLLVPRYEFGDFVRSVYFVRARGARSSEAHVAVKL